MRIDLLDLTSEYETVRARRRSRHPLQDRMTPSILQYDYLALHSLAVDVKDLISSIPQSHDNASTLALDVGSGKSPYRDMIESQGFSLVTLDVDGDSNPDYIGSIEKTGLASESFDLIICTQVLEHTENLNEAMKEICRILKPGGHLIVSVPHVWFYHPYPGDYWRFTQQGLPCTVKLFGLEPKKLLSQGGSVLCFFQILNFFLFGAFGRWGKPAYALNNFLGILGDKLVNNQLLCINFALLAQKP